MAQTRETTRTQEFNQPVEGGLILDRKEFLGHRLDRGFHHQNFYRAFFYGTIQTHEPGHFSGN